MADRLQGLAYDALMAGWSVALTALLLPMLGGLLTSPGQLVGVGWLTAALYVAVFGACLLAIGYGLLILVHTGTWLVRKFLAWRHSRIWRPARS